MQKVYSRHHHMVNLDCSGGITAKHIRRKDARFSYSCSSSQFCFLKTIACKIPSKIPAQAMVGAQPYEVLERFLINWGFKKRSH